MARKKKKFGTKTSLGLSSEAPFFSHSPEAPIFGKLLPMFVLAKKGVLGHPYNQGEIGLQIMGLRARPS